ncbi:MAG: HEAT repeat domain-containing protein [Phycisphaerae bacterium]|nr:HEAT repeat domain-containing protein [Phycisphaerae bacterium]
MTNDKRIFVECGSEATALGGRTSRLRSKAVASLPHSTNRRIGLLVAIASLLAGCNNSMTEKSGFQWKRDSKYTWTLERINQDEKIVQMVASTRPDQRREAINWLGSKPENCASDPIVKLLDTIVKSDPDPTVRAAAVRALGRSVNPASVEPLVWAMADRNDFVRLDVVRSLSAKRGDNVKRVLLGRMEKDTSPQVRAGAAAALCEYRERRVLEELIAALRDPEFVVAYQAEQSLIKLTGHTCEYDPAAWTRWLAAFGADGDPFARAGQTPSSLDQATLPAGARFQNALHRMWFWWQADAKPGE